MKKLFNSRLSFFAIIVVCFFHFSSFASGETDDFQALEIQSIQLSKTSLCFSDRIKVTALIHDDLSGVKNVQLSFILDNHVITVPLIYMSPDDSGSPPDGKYHGFIEIPKDQAIGYYTLQTITVSDQMGNIVCLSTADRTLPPEWAEIGFRVYQSGADVTKPSVLSLSIDKTAVDAPGGIVVAAELSDDHSGIEMASVTFCSDSGRYLSATLNYNGFYYEDRSTGQLVTESFEDGRWYGYIDIGEHMQPEKYELYSVRVEDKAENSLYLAQRFETGLPAEFLNIQFTIYSDTPDIMPPKIREITLDKTALDAPGGIVVTATIEDDLSGVKNASVEFRTENYNIVRIDLTYNGCSYFEPSTGQLRTKTFNDEKWHGYISLGDYAASGIYKFSSAEVYDKSRNRSYYHSDDFLDLQFVVFNSMPDITAPMLHSITLDKTFIAAPGGVVIAAELTDDLSGVIAAEINFRSETGKYLSASLTHNGYTYYDIATEEYRTETFSDDRWYGYIDICDYVLPGIYQFYYGVSYDKAGNRGFFSPLDESIQFEVINEISDITLPDSEIEIDSSRFYETDFAALSDYVLNRSASYGLTEDYSAINASTVQFYEKTIAGAAENVTYCGNTLIIAEDYTISIRQVFQNADNCLFRVDDVPTVPCRNGEYLYVELGGYRFGQLGKMHRITVTDEEGNMLTVISCPLSYAYDLLTKQEDDELKLLARVMVAADSYAKERGLNTDLWVWPFPASNRISCTMKPRWGGTHSGIDIDGFGFEDSEIVACKAGTVIMAESYGGYGNCVMIDHYDGYVTLYGHLSSISVAEGQFVSGGQNVGIVGSTGAATGTQLHLEFIVHGSRVNPLNYYDNYVLEDGAGDPS